MHTSDAPSIQQNAAMVNTMLSYIASICQRASMSFESPVPGRALSRPMATATIGTIRGELA
jgi:hypothetical protein